MQAYDVSVWLNQDENARVECGRTSGGSFVHHYGPFTVPQVVRRAIERDPREGDVLVGDDLYEYLGDPSEDEGSSELYEDDDTDFPDAAIAAAHVEEFAKSMESRLSRLANAAREFSASPLTGDWVRVNGLGVAQVSSVTDNGARLWVQSGSKLKHVPITQVEGWGPKWMERALLDLYAQDLLKGRKRR